MPTLSLGNIPSIVLQIHAAELQHRVSPILTHVVETFGTRAVTQIDPREVFQTDRRVAAFLKQQRGALINVNRTTQRGISRILAEGVDQGLTVGQIADNVVASFARMAEGRALSIARTSVNTASNFASVEGYRQAKVQQKSWLTTDGGDARDTHQEMDGQTVDIEDDFESPDGGTAAFPGDFGDPAEDCNCRCGVMPVMDERTMRAGSRRMVWKILERLRSPWDRAVHGAVVRAFNKQREVVLVTIRAYDDVATAA